MTTAAREIEELDKSLAVDGEDFVLRRVIGSTNQVNVDVVCRGFIRDYKPMDLTTTIIEGDSLIILSPTQITNAQWPGGQPASTTPVLDTRVPRRGDKAVVQGKVRNVQAAMPIYLANRLCRIELQVRG